MTCLTVLTRHHHDVVCRILETVRAPGRKAGVRVFHTGKHFAQQNASVRAVQNRKLLAYEKKEAEAVALQEWPCLHRFFPLIRCWALVRKRPEQLGIVSVASFVPTSFLLLLVRHLLLVAMHLFLLASCYTRMFEVQKLSA